MFPGEWKGWLLITFGWLALGLVASAIALVIISRCGVH
jgi:hypothetical protein